MKKLWLGITLFLVLLLVACGSTNQEVNSGEGGGEMVKELHQQLKEVDGNYSLLITNDTDEDVTLSFTSGQQFDYQLINDAKETVYTWSMNKSFTQALSEKTLAPGEEWELPLDLKNELSSMSVPAGTYQLDVWSLAEQFEGEKVSMNDFEWQGN